MTNTDLASLVGLAGFLFIVVSICAAFLVPIAVLSMANSLRAIRRELERMNGGAEHLQRYADNAAKLSPRADAGQSLAHRLTR